MSVRLADEPTMVQRLLQHIDAASTDLSEAVWREPTIHYTDPGRLAAEVQVMRRTPIPFCPSAALPEAGSYIAGTAAMTPLLAVRGNDGVARVFRNACRHRGAQVAEGHGCKAALSCPYHGWTYGLDGRLRGIPHEHGFPGVDKAEHSLVPVHAVEAHGMVFVSQDAPIDQADIDVIPDLLGPEWRLIGAGEAEIAVNWKIVTEGVLEGYHIRATHPETFFPRQYDNINVIETFGRNSRVTYPFQAIERLRDLPQAEQRTGGVLTHVYHLFPNAAVATFPTHRVLTMFDPVAVDRTRTVSYTLTMRADAEDERTKVAKGRNFVADGTAEDNAVQLAVQRGLAARANDHFTFGLFEGAIRHLHANLAEAIDG